MCNRRRLMRMTSRRPRPAGGCTWATLQRAARSQSRSNRRRRCVCRCWAATWVLGCTVTNNCRWGGHACWLWLVSALAGFALGSCDRLFTKCTPASSPPWPLRPSGGSELPRWERMQRPSCHECAATMRRLQAPGRHLLIILHVSHGLLFYSIFLYLLVRRLQGP